MYRLVAFEKVFPASITFLSWQNAKYNQYIADNYLSIHLQIFCLSLTIQEEDFESSGSTISLSIFIYFEFYLPCPAKISCIYDRIRCEEYLYEVPRPQLHFRIASKRDNMFLGFSPALYQ